jgi:hypothetical protein
MRPNSWRRHADVTAIAADNQMRKLMLLAGVVSASASTVSGPLGVVTVTDENLTGVSPVVNGASTGLSSVSWNPTISVTLPANAQPGVYTATITHSVA